MFPTRLVNIAQPSNTASLPRRFVVEVSETRTNDAVASGFPTLRPGKLSFQAQEDSAEYHEDMSKRRSGCPDPANPSHWIAVSVLLWQDPDEDEEDEDEDEGDGREEDDDEGTDEGYSE